MDNKTKLRLLTWAIVNLFYINHYHQIAPCNYVKADGWIYLVF